MTFCRTMTLRRHTTSVRMDVVCAAALSGAAMLTGCENGSMQRTARDFDGRRNVVHGLVVPADAYVELASTAAPPRPDDWITARNDADVNPRPAAYPWAFQYVELWQEEDLRIINGRPSGFTSSETRTYRLQRRR